jgi:hypothetical protein
MKNRNLLIGAGVVVVGYLIWKKNQNDSLQSRQYSFDCENRYSELMQPEVVMPKEYWEKRKEEWMKINCK